MLVPTHRFLVWFSESDAGLILDRYKSVLISLYTRLHELEKNRSERTTLALEIQEELLRRLVRAEGRMRKARQESTQIKQHLQSRGNTREISGALRERYNSKLHFLENQKTLILTLRAIGDSVAFIYGDPHELKQLASGGNPGFISGKRGTHLERAIMRKAFQCGAAAVLNDLTSNLRHSDISVFRPDLWPKGGSPFLLIEAKTGRGGNKQRSLRQQDAVKAIYDYINSDIAYDEFGTHIRVATREDISHHGDAMTRLAKNLPPQGWLYEEIEPGLHYCLIDCALNSEQIHEIFAALADGSRIWAMMSMNEQKKVVQGYYPFPLLIRDPEALFRFYNGEFVAYVLVDITRVNQVIALDGLEVRFSGEAWQVVRLVPDDGWGERYVTPRAIGLFAAEFVSLRWFIDNILRGEMQAAMTGILDQASLQEVGSSTQAISERPSTGIAWVSARPKQRDPIDEG